MSENKKQGLSQLASMLELYVQQEVPDLAQEGASALPPSCRDPLSLIAKVGWTPFNTIVYKTQYTLMFAFVFLVRSDMCIIAVSCTHKYKHAYSTRPQKDKYVQASSVSHCAWIEPNIFPASVIMSVCVCVYSKNIPRSYSLKANQLPSIEFKLRIIMYARTSGFHPTAVIC